MLLEVLGSFFYDSHKWSVFVKFGQRDCCKNSMKKIEIFEFYRGHAVTLFVDFVILFLDVKFAEKVESYDGVYVDDNRQEHHCENELFSVVRYRLQDRSESLESNGYVE